MYTRKAKEMSQQRRPSLEGNPRPSEQMAILEELKTLYNDMKEDIQALKRDMNAMRKEIKQEIRQEIRAELKDIKETLGKATEDIRQMESKVEKIEGKTDKVNKRISEIEKKYERDLDERALQDLKQRENCIKIRGLREKEDENLYEYLVPRLAEYVGAEQEQFQWEISKLFRINSKIARQKKLPRDVVIYFTRKKIRDEIIQLNYEQSLEVEGKELIIYKDIPLRILKKRNEYRPLITLLRNNDIIYRWDRLEGVIFKFKAETFRINSVLKMKDFIKKHRGDMDKRNDPPQEEKEEDNKDTPSEPEEERKAEEEGEI